MSTSMRDIIPCLVKITSSISPTFFPSCALTLFLIIPCSRESSGTFEIRLDPNACCALAVKATANSRVNKKGAIILAFSILNLLYL